MRRRPIRRRAVGRPARLIGRRCIECGASALSIARNRTTIRSPDRVRTPPPPPASSSRPLRRARARTDDSPNRALRSSLARAEERGQCRAAACGRRERVLCHLARRRRRGGGGGQGEGEGRTGPRGHEFDGSMGRRGNLMSFQGCKCRARDFPTGRRARSITTLGRRGATACPAAREESLRTLSRSRDRARYVRALFGPASPVRSGGPVVIRAKV